MLSPDHRRHRRQHALHSRSASARRPSRSSASPASSSCSWRCCRLPRGSTPTMTASGDPNRALVLRSGSDTEMTSGFGGEPTRIIQDAPGIARDDSARRSRRRSCSWWWIIR